MKSALKHTNSNVIPMSPNYSSLHQDLVKTITAAAPKKLSAADKRFVEHFYALSPVSDLEELEPARASAIALGAHTFLAHRKPGAPKLSVEPFKTEDGRGRTRVIAVNDDMPFLVDSLSTLFTSLGLTVHLILHPILAVKRDAKGKLSSAERADEAAANLPRESIIYAELSALPHALTANDLIAKMEDTLLHVRAAVGDWKAMRSSVLALTKQFHGKSAEAAEACDMIEWLASNHFVFLGYAEYDAVSGGKKPTLILNKKSALGIYKLPPADKTAIERAAHTTTDALISVLNASDFSQVHRRVHMDYIAVRRTSASGKYLGEARIIGLFTSTVFYRETEQIPYIRRKTARILARAGFRPASHSAKVLKTALEFLPREELFQMEEEQLFQMAMRIVSLESKPEARLFVHKDPFGRFISAMVYVPREHFSTALREQIVTMLERAYQGRFATFYTQVSESPLARVTIQIDTQGQIPEVNVAHLEEKIAALANVWSDALHDAILDKVGEADGEQLATSYANAFPPAYVNSHNAKEAAFDIRRMQDATAGDGLALELFRRDGEALDQLHLKCYTIDLKSELSSIIPLLENMGCTVIDATPYVITPLAPLPPILLRDFTLRVAGAGALDLATNKARIEEAIGRVWRAQTDNDTLNALVFSAGLTARDVEILRAYSRYLQQLDFPYSQAFIATALGNHAAIARQLVTLFHARFDPATKNRTAKMDELKTAIEAAVESITNLAEDRVVRRFLALIFASLRTNFYQRSANGQPKDYLSIKFRSKEIPGMPLPVPFAEIFVTSLRMEGIHLRGGPVARGGLRWSDRPEDFRTEVLGLVKAQMVKNAVIVPTGSKGGFILRKPPVDRDAFTAEGVFCYQTFLRGLLDVTDNIKGTVVIPPTDVVRHDNDDPYLVVAADKGTATFSDIANRVAREYNFWLDDAFASGGSAGYDHKAMAITARGGWVAVERHFREMGKDIAKETFTAVGIGDMAGDVFGNGMLLSKNLRLIAAFNHRHIFIDPTPDAAKSFVERQRLFNLPRSNWTDYDAALISKGGGVFERSAKSIKLTPEMRSALGTDLQTATPDELIRAILKSPVDLLWNGGIGTYVKATSETHEQVGDRANAALRLNGKELRCKIVGEGGNLGCTQRGRIEYARAGGRINTDAIDNSGGVDCSDHEVNIKIALGAAVGAKRLTIPKRDALLKKMTDDVAHLVLLDNKLQTQAITIAEQQGHLMLEPAEQLINVLEASGLLNREVEFLPDAKQFGELRASKLGLTRPEIAVLLAYAKMALFQDLATSKVLDGPYYDADLMRYFPKEMQKAYAGDIRSHRLKREIVATMITNSVVNRTGFSFAQSLQRATGLPAADIAQAYVATRDAFKLRSLWAEIEALDGVIDAKLQSQLFANVNLFIEESCRWFLQHVAQPMKLEQVMERYAEGIAQVEKKAESLMTDTLKKAYLKSVEELIAAHVPETLARRIAKLEILASACDIVDLSASAKMPLEAVGRLYFEVGAQLKLGWLRRAARHLSGEHYWQQLAIKSLVIELYQAQRRLTQEMVRRYGKRKGDPTDAWSSDVADSLKRYLAFIEEMRTQQSFDYPMLIVAMRQVQWISSQ